MNFLQQQNAWNTNPGLNLFNSLQTTERSSQDLLGSARLSQSKRPPTTAMEQLVVEVTVPATRERALLELSKKRESFQELAPYLWHSFGVTAALLQEVVSVYALLVPPAPALSAPASNRVCNALALLQCVASHAETRSLFLQGRFPFIFQLEFFCFSALGSLRLSIFEHNGHQSSIRISAIDEFRCRWCIGQSGRSSRY